LDSAYVARFLERSQYEAARTAPPEGFPKLPDLPLGRYTDPRQMEELVVANINGAPIKIRDIGRVEDGTKEQRSIARLNGVPTVTLEIRRQSNQASHRQRTARRARRERTCCRASWRRSSGR